MWNKKKPEPVNTIKVAEPAAPRKPSALERLKKLRADKIELVKRLDREIAQLDHDITYIERFPEHARVLEFIAARFKEEENPQLHARSAVPSL